jgi:hypothetical protein
LALLLRRLVPLLPAHAVRHQQLAAHLRGAAAQLSPAQASPASRGAPMCAENQGL